MSKACISVLPLLSVINERYLLGMGDRCCRESIIGGWGEGGIMCAGKACVQGVGSLPCWLILPPQ